MKNILVFLGIVFCLAVLIIPAEADVANISATADAEVRENQATSNFGTDQLIRVSSNGASDRRSLLKFDLSSIPAGSTINSATLTLFMDTAPGANRNHELHFSSTTVGWRIR